MRMLRIGILVAVGLGLLGLDVGASLRAGAIRQSEAHAAKHHRKRHRKRRRRHHHHRRHHPAPAQEM